MTAARTKTALAFLAPSGSKRKRRTWAIVGIVVMLQPGCFALADPGLPQGARVAQGNVAIVTPDANNMTITQGSNRAVVNWDSFSVGQGAHVDIRQPSTDAALLNRVTGSTTSEIHGRITANGQVHLVNPNGIFIGPTGAVNTGAFVASTLSIEDGDFMAGRLTYNGSGSSATVENAGQVTIGRGGYAALLGGRVKNSGTVVVPYGRIGFAAGERVTLNVSGDNFLDVALPSDLDGEEALIENSGLASAEAGLIEMRAATARHAVRHAVNLSGVAEATSVSTRGGKIILGGGAGGRVTVSGRASTRAEPSALIVESSKRPVMRGGEIEITGHEIALAGAQIDASGADGGGAIWIGGDFAGQGDLQRAETTTSDAATRITADALQNGDGGEIVVWSDVYTAFAGTLSARGGYEGGNGGFIEVSSPLTLAYTGLADTRAPLGAWGTLLLDPTDITINPGVDEANLEANLAAGNVTLDTSGAGTDPGNITINADIDWTVGTELSLIADNDINLNGALNGASGSVVLQAANSISLNGAITTIALRVDANNTVTPTVNGGVSVNIFEFVDGSWNQVGPTLAPFEARFTFDTERSDGFLRVLGGSGSTGDPFLLTDIYGLQGMDDPSFDNSSFTLANNIDASVTATWDVDESAFGFRPIGGGYYGTLDGAGFEITDLFMETDNTEGLDPAGLFNRIESGGVVRDLTLTNVEIIGFEGGAIASQNDGLIENVRVTGTFEGEGDNIGGVVGTNNGTIQDSIADVAVSMDNSMDGSTQTNIGGFVGVNNDTILRSHALGTVTANNTNAGDSVTAGGFVGVGGGSTTLTDSYARGNVSVTTVAGGGLRIAGGFAGQLLSDAQRSYSTGTVSVVGDSAPTIGGFSGVDTFGSTSSFWDSTTSGLGTSAGGTPLSTAQFQDTETFIALAGSQGWDFDTVWAPGDTGEYPVNYTTTAVVFATPNGINDVQYGLTGSATTSGTVAGGSSVFVFDSDTDVLDTSGLFNALTFAGQDVGAQNFTLSTTSLTSNENVSYRVIDRVAVANVTPAPLTITANDATKVEGTTLVFDGTEFTTGTLFFSDSVDTVTLSSDGAGADAALADSPFDIVASNAQGTGLSNYDITFETGTLTLEEGEVENEVTIPPIFNGTPPTNPNDDLGLPDVDGDDDTVAALDDGDTVALAEAEETLSEVEDIAGGFEDASGACGQEGGDVGKYLACLSDALSDFAGELDTIAADLPPGLGNVAQIVQTARVEVDAARSRAEARLATATTEAERQAIRRDAVNEARGALATASAEIRKAITLVRADDADLAAVQRQTVSLAAAAVDNAGLTLARATGL